eukprot:TRINITY_DN35015_c0_g1_i1.p1 TRINITY_DN35015_c0_g1~~TRINITY_DN35015_c0_g1_i1.p1  ORF type:complete len:498 (+),score=92.25 TRINITY_DN35015_c0_g1_i1:144-1637(+)
MAIEPELSRPSGSLGQSRGYSHIRSVGRGSYGTALLARDGLGKQCVMKTIKVGRQDSGQHRLAAAEVSMLAALKHPYIVRFRESFLEQRSVVIVMDYAEGGDLCGRICSVRENQSTFSEALVVRWLTQTALALKYVHGRNIVHRDVKPQNIFLTKEDDVRLGDFGISQVVDLLKAPKAVSKPCLQGGSVLGTPMYMAPEVCNEALYSFASDVWALGCIVYELCALKPAFQGSTLQELTKAICQSQPSMPATYSAELRKLGRDLLIQERTQRSRAAAVVQRRIVQEEIARILEEERQGGKSQAMVLLGGDASDTFKPLLRQCTAKALCVDAAAHTPGRCIAGDKGCCGGSFPGSPMQFDKARIATLLEEAQSQLSPHPRPLLRRSCSAAVLLPDAQRQPRPVLTRVASTGALEKKAHCWISPNTSSRRLCSMTRASASSGRCTKGRQPRTAAPSSLPAFCKEGLCNERSDSQAFGDLLSRSHSKADLIKLSMAAIALN